jgi:hypothetical protein
MGEERDYLKDTEQEREAFKRQDEDPDVEGHRHRPMHEEGAGEGEGPDVEGHSIKSFNKP